MKRRAVVPVLLVPSLLVGGCSLHSGLTATTTVPEVELMVSGAVPPGSTRQEIEAWLAGQGIDFHYSDRPRSESAVSRLPDAGNYSGLIVGIIRDTDRSLFVTGSIQIYFLLDTDGRLSRWQVKRIGTGP